MFRRAAVTVKQQSPFRQALVKLINPTGSQPFFGRFNTKFSSENMWNTQTSAGSVYDLFPEHDPDDVTPSPFLLRGEQDRRGLYAALKDEKGRLLPPRDKDSSYDLADY